METLTDLTQIHTFFPFSDQEGRSTKAINKKRISDLAKNAKPILANQLDQIIEKHFDFLFAGGSGGSLKN